MDRSSIYALLHGKNNTDYERYLDTATLFTCQKPFDQLANHDELLFQVVHQIEELWLKLINFTLLEILDEMENKNTHRIRTLFQRVHCTQRLMINQLGLLETMSPKDYEDIRQQLGNGSGQESPGFIAIQHFPRLLWQAFETHYLDHDQITLMQIYNDGYQHGEAYVMAECLAEFDELMQKFRYHHVQLIHRTIGFGAKSLKGRSVSILEKAMQIKYFPKLWEIRNQMTDLWGAEYGYIRDNLDQSGQT